MARSKEPPVGTPLVYALHTGDLYGMEKMSLATVAGLRERFNPVIFCPPGPAVGEARAMGFTVVEIPTLRAFCNQIVRYLAHHPDLVFCSTRTLHSLIFSALNLVFRRRAVHLHIVHGFHETGPLGMFAGVWAKRLLNCVPVTVVAVSQFVRKRLLEQGLNDRRIRVIENFLPTERVASARRRPAFTRPGVRRAVVVSRLVPLKRIDILLTCLEISPQLRGIEFHIFGAGDCRNVWEARAVRSGLNVVFEGFHADVAEHLAQADLLVHLCPVEACGLALLEAMAANIPVVAPDRGGAGAVVDHGRSGMHYRADNAASLAASLSEIVGASPEQLNGLVAGARVSLETRFSAPRRLADYLALMTATEN